MVLENNKVKFLTWIIYLLITLNLGLSGWSANELFKLSDKYVQKERYICDTDRLESSIDKVLNKLDKLNDRVYQFQIEKFGG